MVIDWQAKCLYSSLILIYSENTLKVFEIFDLPCEKVIGTVAHCGTMVIGGQYIFGYVDGLKWSIIRP